MQKKNNKCTHVEIEFSTSMCIFTRINKSTSNDYEVVLLAILSSKFLRVVLRVVINVNAIICLRYCVGIEKKALFIRLITAYLFLFVHLRYEQMVPILVISEYSEVCHCPVWETS